MIVLNISCLHNTLHMQLPCATPTFVCTVVSVAFSVPLVDLLNRIQESKPRFLLNPIQQQNNGEQQNNRELF